MADEKTPVTSENVACLKEMRQSLADVNSRSPATQEFLLARGLSHVDELDEQGNADLVEHLQNTLLRIYSFPEERH